MIKRLIWLIKNQKKIEELLNKPEPEPVKDTENFSTDGVPDFQKGYVEDLLNGNTRKK